MLNQVFFAGASDGLALGNMLFLLIAFVILMLLLKKFAWGPVVKMMDDRANKVAHDLDSAEDARQQAEKLSKERQEQLTAARTDANKIVADAKKSADAQGKQIVADAQTNAQTLKDRAATQIEQDRSEAMTSAKNDVADLSVTIAQKIIQKELKLDDQKALIDAYIDGLGEK
ncbi:F0F1 ATP synthase subunit B [Weissella viridescens]|jgi:F-type H+-transporting ATPase subunit b|uniref:F0F1 ATP synthase subunit B n=1 Tax=Weissella viridescens TaxID=1629 RepID=UPI001745CAD2|nr:F0F1 ATP synthase subunit B [Weissella viridescens]MBX4173085.1 F0F1 ATP synthase subunit B [Weissella viridescens]MCB6840704.1 F0F1 ATP synthase subunit B [Weissella viridescens]MCB6847437.1 F0F1 ATP synthase subunit B [Weissella viridescens]QOD86169.1 F0F1 ATP synthase subunit B [Weissella viridescens]